MRRPLVLLTSAFAIALAAPAQAQDPRIAAGVSAAGVDLTGLTLPEAAAALDAAHAATLARPVLVSSAGRHFSLTPAKIGYRFDALRTARRAFQQGYQPHTGALDVNLYVTYDKKKVTAFARRVIAGVTIRPRDARVHIRLTHISKVPSRRGRTLKLDALKTAIRAALIDPRVSRTVKPKIVRTQPTVTTAGLARRYGTVITIDRSSFRLRLFKRLKVAKTYRVAVGMPAYPTPTGLFSIANKAVNPAWTAPNSPWAGAYANETVPGGSAENPLKARWMGIVNGVGIHGTGVPGSIGTAASHGCIRMTVPDVIDLYPRVPVGTPVLIGG
jgi:lipoprotein-anchoring transpeptidase ErfK/SrfK